MTQVPESLGEALIGLQNWYTLGMKVFVTGISGTGKTSIANALNLKGIKAFSMDEVDGLCQWINRETGDIVDYEAKLDRDFIDSHIWVCNTDKLKNLIEGQEGVAVLGMAENQNEFLSLFDKILLLQCAPETFLSRIERREDNIFGKDKTAQGYILETYREFENDMLEKGAISINVEKPFDEVEERIISEINGRNIASVELSKPDPIWTRKFESAKGEILDACGDRIVSIEHIGSTSIPNLSAKPEIDILIGVNSLDDAEKCVGPLKSIDYPYYKRFEEFVPDRRYFRKSDGTTPLVHIHMYEIKGETYKNHLLFRDYMRVHPEAVVEYEKLKRRLLEESKGDRGVYQDGKIEFTKHIIEEAKASSSPS
jgi:GrpB-like predicted nucleotidyltransferase (UPF0157 family)/dephospho-CoA kinase